MTREIKQETDSQSVDVGVRRKPGKQRGHLATVGHGLYFHPEKFKIDGRSALGKAIYKIVHNILEPFQGAAPAPAKLLAKRTAYKLLRAASYEAYVLNGGTPAPSTDNDYLRLTGSIRADLQLLHMMGKVSPIDGAPDLREYLETLKKAAKATQIIQVKADGNCED